jgi:hypothetical protein
MSLAKDLGSLLDSSGLVTNDKLDNPGRRNIIINGDMRIAQRATSVTGITASDYYTVDRWRNTISGLGTWSFSQSTDTPTGQGFGYSHKLDCTTADGSPATGDYFILTQLLEGQDLQRLKKGTSNAESVTVSFWVKSTKTGTYILEFEDADNTRSISQSYTVDSASTWEKKTLTFAGDTTGAFTNDTGASLVVNFWYGAGTDYTSGTLNTSWGSRTAANIAPGLTNLGDNTANELYITGVQLEVGSTASDFEHIQYTEQLKLCERYFEVCGQGASGVAEATNSIAITEKFNTLKRRIPTLSLKASQQCAFRHQASDKTLTPTGLTAPTPSYRGFWTRVDGFSGLTLQASIESRNNTASRGGFIFADAEL